MAFFLFLIILFLFIIYVLPGIVKWRLRKVVEKRAATFQEQARAWENEYRREHRSAGWSHEGEKPHEKVITKDMGEYVDFEEVTEVNYEECRKDGGGKKFSSRTESRITDVKWEEIKD
ncbi:MAG: DUF4834 family protein [Paramuribaculum sp.]|nr:DUF4834 family protein [Paramuribaculum sp.]